MNSSVSPTHADQEGRAQRGQSECNCYHPLLLLNQHGDLERVLRRNGTAHCADDRRRVIEPVATRYRNEAFLEFSRVDAAFASPEVDEFVERKSFFCAIRLPSSAVFEAYFQGTF